MWSTRSSSKELSFKLIRAETMGQGVSSKKRQCPTYQTCQLVGQANEVDLIVGDTYCTALLDTGSMVSTISADICRSMNLEIQPLDEIIQLESAGGHKLSYLGLVQTDISIPISASTDDLINGEQKHIPITERPASKKLPAVFLVVPHTTYHNRVPVLLGTNILGLLWNDKENPKTQHLPLPWHIAHQSLQHLQRIIDNKGSLGDVTSSKAILIPAGSKKRVRGKTRASYIMPASQCLFG